MSYRRGIHVNSKLLMQDMPKVVPTTDRLRLERQWAVQTVSKGEGAVTVVGFKLFHIVIVCGTMNKNVS